MDVGKSKLELIEGWKGFIGDTGDNPTIFVRFVDNYYSDYYTIFKRVSYATQNSNGDEEWHITYTAPDGTIWYVWEATDKSYPENSDVSWPVGARVLTNEPVPYTNYRTGIDLWTVVSQTTEISNFPAAYNYLTTNELNQTIAENAFDCLEPYYCGLEAVPQDIFPNAGHYQAYNTTECRFAKPAAVPGYFNADNKQLIGCRRGSIPMTFAHTTGANNQVLSEHTYTDSASEVFFIYKSFDKLYVRNKLGTHEEEITVEEINRLRDADHYPSRRISELPSRIGIVLVGAGGGAGGISWYDKSKNGSDNDQYNYPGGGGGGGAIAWGVLDISRATRNTAFVIKLGKGGTNGSWVGWSNTDSLSHNHPITGGRGGDGEASSLGISSIDKPDYKDWEKNLLLQVSGGAGGAPGAWSGKAAGGAGGQSVTVNNASDRFWYCGSWAGGAGADFDTSGEATYASGLNIPIAFLKDSSEDGRYTYTVSHPQVQSTQAQGYKSSINTSNIPGGHSYGRGGTGTTSPGAGGGGHYNTRATYKGGNGCFFLIY